MFLVALEDQPYPIKAAGCQVLFGDVEIDVPAVSEHQLEVAILHDIQLEQQHPAVTGRFFRPLTNLLWNLNPAIAQIVSLVNQITFGKHAVLDHIGPAQQLGAVIRVLWVLAGQFLPCIVESLVILLIREHLMEVLPGRIGVFCVHLDLDHRKFEIFLHINRKVCSGQCRKILKPIDAGAALVLGVIAPALGIRFIEEGEQAVIGQKMLFVKLGSSSQLNCARKVRGQSFTTWS